MKKLALSLILLAFSATVFASRFIEDDSGPAEMSEAGATIWLVLVVGAGTVWMVADCLDRKLVTRKWFFITYAVACLGSWLFWSQDFGGLLVFGYALIYFVHQWLFPALDKVDQLLKLGR